MNKIKLAILEDSSILLNGLIRDVEHTGLAKVSAFSTNPEEFIEKVKERRDSVDALLLDIEMEGHAINGLDVAKELSDKPLYFITSKAASYVERISSMKLDEKRLVDFTSKNIDDRGLKIILKRLADAVTDGNHIEVDIQLKGGALKSIPFNDIVAIETNQGSQCKTLHIFNSEPEKTREYTFPDLLDKLQFKKHGFLQVSKYFLINLKHVQTSKVIGNFAAIEFNQESLSKGIKVSPSYAARLKEALRKVE